MRVKKTITSSGSEAYYLLDGPRGNEDYLASFGSSCPEFTGPDLRLGFCEQEMQTIESGSVDLILDDPPYGTTQADWDTEPDWEVLAEQFHRVLADDGQVVVFGKQPSLFPVYNILTANGFDFRFELIWKKQNNPWVSHHQPIPIHENIFVFKKSQTKVSDLTFRTEDVRRDGVFVCPRCEDEQNLGSYKVPRGNKNSAETKGSWQEDFQGKGGEDRHPVSYLDRDVIEATSVGGFHEEYMGHAGQKPVALLRWLLIAMTGDGKVLLDYCAFDMNTVLRDGPRVSLGPSPKIYSMCGKKAGMSSPPIIETINGVDIWKEGRKYGVYDGMVEIAEFDKISDARASARAYAESVNR